MFFFGTQQQLFTTISVDLMFYVIFLNVQGGPYVLEAVFQVVYSVI